MFSTLGYARVVSATQFECIVCRLTKNTVAELHRHQTFLHTTEELSLAVIGLRNSLINNAVNSQNATSCSWLYKPLKHSEFYSLSAILLDDEHNFARFERSVPLDCVVKRKCANTEELCVPKARLLKTLEDKRIRRREQNRRAKIFRTLNNGVLDLSLPKSSRKGKSKLKNTVANTFYQGNIQSAAILDSRKEKKLSKETSGNKKRMDNPAPLKQEPISMDEEYREEKKTAMPQTTHLLDEVLKLAVKSFKNEESLENSIYDDDAEETSECSNLVVDEFSHLGSSSIPLRVSDFSSKPEAYYKNRTEKNKGLTENKRKSCKKDRLSGRVGKRSSKKSKKGALKNRNKKSSQSTKHRKIEADENFDDHTCFNISEIPGETSDTTEIIYKQDEIPNVHEEYSSDDIHPNPLNHHDDSQLDGFQGVTQFPAYPEDIDEHSILVFDPESRGLVWTSFELVDDPRSSNGEKNSEDMESDIQPKKIETILHHGNNNFFFDYCTLQNFQQRQNLSFQHGLDKNITMMEEEETSTNTLAFLRPKRRRTCPDRYIPH